MISENSNNHYKNLMSYLFACFGFLGTLATLIGLDRETVGIWYYIILGSLCILCAVGIFGVIIYAIKEQKLVIRYLVYLISPKQPLILLDKTCIYTFRDRTHMTYQKNFTIQSKIPTLHSFYDMYMWTKDYKKQEIETINSTDKITHEYTQEQWQFYCINFSDFIGKNKIYKTGIFMPSLEDPKKESQLFLSTGIFEPTTSITLQVVIQNGLKFREGSTYCKVYNNYYGRAADDQVPLNIEQIADDEGGGQKISFSIKYPVKGARYRLTWEFEGK